MVPVNIFILDNELVPQPIEGVVVQVLNPTSEALVAQATSDVNGRAAFMLPGSASPGTSYEVRFFMLGVLFNNPLQIAVEDPLPGGDTNNFNITGTLVGTIQPAIDPRLCRVQGRFMNLSNQPVPYSTVRIMARAQTGAENPKYVDENLISVSEMGFKTDQNGYFVVDLFRTGNFEIVFAGEDDTEWPFYVPDAPYALWGDLINPYPVSIAWNQTIAPSNALSMTLGQNPVLVPFTALFSNTQMPISGLSKWLNFFSSDTADEIIGLQQADMGVLITAVGVGGATITGANKPCLLPPRIPYYSTVVPPLAVTVVS